MRRKHLGHLVLEVFAVSPCSHTATKGYGHRTFTVARQLEHLLVNLVLLGYDTKLSPQFLIVLANLLGEQLPVLGLNVGDCLILVVNPVCGICRDGTKKLPDT